jgi:predicted lactoylglutathione lyase
MIESYKRLSSEFTKINQELQNLKTTVITFKETIKKILEEMSEFSTKQEIKVLEKYINMWNPLNFVTTEEIEKIIDEKLKKGDKSAGKKKK